MGRDGRHRSPSPSSSSSSDSGSSSSSDSESRSESGSSSDSDGGAAALVHRSHKRRHRRSSHLSTTTLLFLLLGLLTLLGLCGVGAYFYIQSKSGASSSSAAAALSSSDAGASESAASSAAASSQVGSSGTLDIQIKQVLQTDVSASGGGNGTTTGGGTNAAGGSTVPFKTSTTAVGGSTKPASASLAKSSSSSDGEITADKTTSASHTTSGHSSGTSAALEAVASATGTKSVKKGLCYNTTLYVTSFDSYISWVYDWSDDPDDYSGTATYYPMLWGPTATEGFAAAASSAVSSGSDYLLFVNEPDLSAQADMTPSAAASLWSSTFEPLAPLASLVGPSITNGGSPMGITWLQEFVGNCSACSISALAMHWYDSATNEAYFYSYFSTALDTFPGHEIWITEFWGEGTDEEVTAFLENVIPWMEGQDRITRYSAFGDFEGRFVDSEGSLTDLGMVYATTV